MSSEEPSVRRAVPSDEKAVERLWLRLLEEHAAIDERYTISNDAALRFRNDFSGWTKSSEYRVFVAERDAHICGFATAQLFYPPPIHQETTEVYLNEIYCEPEIRGTGAGKALVSAVDDWALELGIGTIRIGVLASNERALAFWKQMGAEPYAVILTRPVT